MTSFDLLHKHLLETSPSSRILRVLDYANEFYLDFLWLATKRVLTDSKGEDLLPVKEMKHFGQRERETSSKCLSWWAAPVV